jgi:uncharacterized metal-binding protein
MSDHEKRIIVVPCSGVGKTFGSVSRESAYEVCDELRPDATRLLALSKLVLGEEEARERVRSGRTITIDGCKLMCAAKLVGQSGGTIVREVAVLDVYRQHKDLKPDGIAELNDAGKQLARVIAEEIAVTIDDVRASSTAEEARHA